MGDITGGLPKSMLEVGGRPLLWHIMHAAARHGSRDFLLALGHRGAVIKDFFLRYPALADFTIELGPQPVVRYLDEPAIDRWQVTCVDTGEGARTGTRLRRLARHVPRWPLVVAYGDVLADVDLGDLMRYHRRHGRLATVTAVAPPSRFGHLELSAANQVVSFAEKPAAAEGWVSAGYFVIERAVVDGYLPVDRDVMFEEDPLRRLALDGELMAYRHDGYWQPVDTPKDLAALRGQWESDSPPWKAWRS
ncbi:glucose-1-phosphate cytidylyltransferase [Actinoplanes utahensis]|nr:glucose-1-phosphate cytidylyltransferase [Actinoplanes utahensis]